VIVPRMTDLAALETGSARRLRPFAAATALQKSRLNEYRSVILASARTSHAKMEGFAVAPRKRKRSRFRGGSKTGGDLVRDALDFVALHGSV